MLTSMEPPPMRDIPRNPQIQFFSGGGLPYPSTAA